MNIVHAAKQLFVVVYGECQPCVWLLCIRLVGMESLRKFIKCS